MIAIVIEDATVAAGELLKAQIRWTGDGGRLPRRIIVAAQWETDGRGDRARGVGRSMQFVPDRADVTWPVRLLIPFDGPVTYDGELIRIAWKLHVRVDRAGFDELASEPFRVEPRRRAARPAASAP